MSFAVDGSGMFVTLLGYSSWQESVEHVPIILCHWTLGLNYAKITSTCQDQTSSKDTPRWSFNFLIMCFKRAWQ